MAAISQQMPQASPAATLSKLLQPGTSALPADIGSFHVSASQHSHNSQRQLCAVFMFMS